MNRDTLLEKAINEVVGREEEKETKLVKVYQAKIDTPYVFFDFDVAYKRFDFEKDYNKVYERETEVSKDHALDDIFEMGNMGELQQYADRMRSISVSDIIEIDDKFYYVEGFGFKDITSYIKNGK